MTPAASVGLREGHDYVRFLTGTVVTKYLSGFRPEACFARPTQDGTFETMNGGGLWVFP